MEVDKDKWFRLRTSDFANLNEKSICREEVVVISLRPSRPLICYGYGNYVPFVREKKESNFQWELPRDGEIGTVPKLDSWFADLFPIEN